MTSKAYDDALEASRRATEAFRIIAKANLNRECTLDTYLEARAHRDKAMKRFDVAFDLEFNPS